MTRSMHLQTCRILTVECINGMVTPIHCNNNRSRRHDCRSDVRIFWKRTVVYDLCDRNLYLPFPPSLSLTHTYTSQHRWEIRPSRQNFKNINKVTWIRIMRSNCDFYAKDDIVKVGLWRGENLIDLTNDRALYKSLEMF